MQVLFEARNPEALVLRGMAVRRTRFVMRRLHWMAARTRVYLDDVSGPRGGVDKRCRIELNTAAAEPVVITSLATDWRRALEAALARAGRALLRLWRRRPDGARPAPDRSPLR